MKWDQFEDWLNERPVCWHASADCSGSLAIRPGLDRHLECRYHWRRRLEAERRTTAALTGSYAYL